MIVPTAIRKGISLTLLLGLVSAYTIRAWHNPALHHHPTCQAEDDLHFHQGEEACSLCDFILSLPLPVDEVSSSTTFTHTRAVVRFDWLDVIPDNVRLGYALRGPPASV